MSKHDVVDFPDRRRIDGEAAEWLIRLDSDRRPNKAERAALREWLARSALHRKSLIELAELWGRMNVLTELRVPLGEVPRRRRIRRGVARFAMLAGSAAVLVAAAVLVLHGVAPTVPSRSEASGLYATAVGQQREQRLPDGSLILLNTNTQIRVEFTGDYRDVRLIQGEAHFTVAENPQRPFRVLAGDSRVEAVGTAFAVHLTEQGVDVAVTDGRVSLATVRPGGQPAAVDEAHRNGSAPTVLEALGTLEAGQRAVIAAPRSREDGAVARLSDLQTVIDVAAIDRRLSWRDGVLSFSGEPLEQVVREISRYTTIDIRIDDPAIRSIPVGGRFPIGETDAMFLLLESNFNLRVTRTGPEQVLLSAAAR